jgi:hypothetical protein
MRITITADEDCSKWIVETHRGNLFGAIYADGKGSSSGYMPGPGKRVQRLTEYLDDVIHELSKTVRSYSRSRPRRNEKGRTGLQG